MNAARAPFLEKRYRAADAAAAPQFRENKVLHADRGVRVPSVSHAGGRLGVLESSSPVFVVVKSTIDPLAVAGIFYFLVYLREGEITGTMFLAGGFALLLAGYLLDGTLLFLRGKRLREELLCFLLAWLFLLALLTALGVISGYAQVIDAELMLWWAGGTPLVLVTLHTTAYWMIHRAPWVERSVRRSLIVGVTQAGTALAAAMSSHKLARLRVEGFFDDREESRIATTGAPILGRLDDLVDYVNKHGVHSIYITLPMTSQPRIVALLDALRDTTASVYFVPDMFVFDLIQARFDHVGGVPVVSVCDSPFVGLRGLAKRSSDIVLALVGIAVSWPLLVAIAVAVKVTSPGPIVFRQRRFGLDGREIVVYKFRTMTVTEDRDDIRQAVPNDERLTPIGAFLRRTSLDELPQLVNVVQGRMSMVGPRPHANAHNELYRKLIKGYMVRHKVRPGITGWAQVNGYRGETATVEKMARRIDYDLEYLRTWSLWLDVRILFRTFLLVLRDSHAY